MYLWRVFQKYATGNVIRNSINESPRLEGVYFLSWMAHLREVLEIFINHSVFKMFILHLKKKLHIYYILLQRIIVFWDGNKRIAATIYELYEIVTLL